MTASQILIFSQYNKYKVCTYPQWVFDFIQQTRHGVDFFHYKFVEGCKVSIFPDSVYHIILYTYKICKYVVTNNINIEIKTFTENSFNRSGLYS